MGNIGTSHVDVVRADSYLGPQTLKPAEGSPLAVPPGLHVTLHHEVDPLFRDANFYPDGLFAECWFEDTPLRLQAFVRGPRNASLQPEDTERLTTPEAFREVFPGGDIQLDSAGGQLAWDADAVFTLLFPDQIASPRFFSPDLKDYYKTEEILTVMFSEMNFWTPWLELFDEECNPQVIFDAVLNGDILVQYFAVTHVNCSEEARAAYGLLVPPPPF